MLVAEKLNLDMARCFEEPFQVNGAVSKGFFCFVSCIIVFFGKGHGVTCGTHALATTTSYGLNDHRVSDLFSYSKSFLFVVDGSIASRNDWNLGLDCHVAGFCFVAEVDDSFFARTNKLDVTLCALFCEVGIFGQETVARVDRIDIRYLGGSNDTVSLQIA